jgi:HK97 family phage prohead protease
MSARPKAQVHFQPDAHLQMRADATLPDGVAGRVSGVALTYETVDSYGTLFARGCAKLTIAGKVAARKVPLLMDHERRTGAHVGVVSMMQEAGDSLMMTADLFDTPEGRAALDYVKTVIAAGASTGFSIGFVPRKAETVTIDGRVAERFLEIELREVSITPMPAVPGADVVSARTDSASAIERSEAELLAIAAAAALDAMPAEARASLLARYEGSRTDDGDGATVLDANANWPTTPDPAARPIAPNANGSRHLSHAQRVSAVRSSFNY